MTEQQQNKNEQVIVNKTFRANSYELGKAGQRFKLYFEDCADLVKQIEDLKKAGFEVDILEEKSKGVTSVGA